MSKRRKKPIRTIDRMDVIALVELRCAIIQHCKALKAVTLLLEQGRIEAAVARLDGAVTVMEATVRGQMAGVTMECPECKTQQDVVAWVDDKKCHHCGADLKLPPTDGGE